MKISELIEYLQKLKEEHGDVDCWHENYSLGCIERIDEPIYKRMIVERTNYTKSYAPGCHPEYIGVFIGGE